VLESLSPEKKGKRIEREHIKRARAQFEKRNKEIEREMSFTDRNPLSLSMPQNKLKALATELEREERRMRESEDSTMRTTTTTTSGERNNRNSNGIRGIRGIGGGGGGGGGGGAFRIDNVTIDRNQPAKLAFLTIEDLKKKARPWREFFSTDHLRKSYRVPRTREEVYVRFDRNVYEYLGNYRRCSWIIALALLYKKPKAIAGGVIILKLYDVLQVLGQTVAIQDSHKTVIQFFVQVLIWVVSIVTRVFASLSMAVAVVFTMLGLHAILLRLDAPKPTKSGKRISGVVWETKSPREMNNANNRGGIGGIIGSLINRNKTQRRT
jgi:hypothetical protein